VALGAPLHSTPALHTHALNAAAIERLPCRSAPHAAALHCKGWHVAVLGDRASCAVANGLFGSSAGPESPAPCTLSGQPLTFISPELLGASYCATAELNLHYIHTLSMGPRLSGCPAAVPPMQLHCTALQRLALGSVGDHASCTIPDLLSCLAPVLTNIIVLLSTYFKCAGCRAKNTVRGIV
jgi:hypothetical protein